MKKGWETFGDQRVDLYRAPRAADDHLVAVLDSFALGQRRADFCEAFGTRPTSQGMLRLMAPVCQCSETVGRRGEIWQTSGSP